MRNPTSAIVDGHDFGSGELNIFVLTNDPIATFELVQEVAKELRPHQQMRVAFRLAREKQVNVRVVPTSQAIDESIELAHEMFMRVFSRSAQEIEGKVITREVWCEDDYWRSFAYYRCPGDE